MIVLATIVRLAVLLGYESRLEYMEAKWAMQSVRAMHGAASGRYHPMDYVWARHPYEPGVAASIYLGGILFRLLGVSPLWFKAMGILFSLPILPLAYVVLSRHIGRRATRITALLIALSPAMYAKWNVKPYYFSFTILANLAMAELVFQIVFERRRSFWRAAALGLVAGLSTLSAPFALPMIAAIALTWVLLGRRTLRLPAALAAVSGFVVGFCPLIYRDWQHDWTYLHTLCERTKPAHFTSLWRALTVRLSYLFGQTGAVEGAAPHTWASLAYFACFAIGLLWLLVRLAPALLRHGLKSHRADSPPAPKETFVLVYILVYLLAWTRSGQEMRYLIPLFPFALVPIAMLIDWLRPRSVQVGALLAVCAAGAFGIVGFSQAPKHGWDKFDYWQPRYKTLVEFLDQQGIAAIYTSHFLAPHLMFESRGRVVAHHEYAAWTGYRDVVDGAKRYAFVYEAGSYYDTGLAEALRRRAISLEKATISNVNVYYRLNPSIRLGDVPGLGVPTHGVCWDEETLHASLRLDPGWTQRRLELARGYFARGRVGDAERAANAALHYDRAAWQAYVLLGRIAHSRKNPSERDRLWQAAVAAHPAAAGVVRRLQAELAGGPQP